MLGHKLIDGDPQPNIRARRLLWSHPRENRRVRARVVARAVRPRPTVLVLESADDLKVILQHCQRFHRLVQDIIRASAVRTPFGEIDAIREIDKRSSQRRTRRSYGLLRLSGGGKKL